MYKDDKIQINEVQKKFFQRIKIPIRDYIQANRFIKAAMSIDTNK